MSYTEIGLALLAAAGWFGFLVERGFFWQLADANAVTVKNFKAAVQAKDDTIALLDDTIALLEARIKMLVTKAERVIVLHDRKERIDGAIEVLRIHTTPIDGEVT
jgi:hypothetical protein